jgi:hypothetical protein
MAVVTVSVHVARVKEFFRIAFELKSSFRAIDVVYFAAEELLARRYEKHPLFVEVRRSVMRAGAYVRTAEQELRGVQDLRSGRYSFGKTAFPIPPQHFSE